RQAVDSARERLKATIEDARRAADETAAQATAPVNEVIEVMSKVEGGDLSARMDTNANPALSSAVNGAITALSRYTGAISSVLGEISRDNLNVAPPQALAGDFTAIGRSLDIIIGTLNETLYEVNASASHVSSGAKHIADSSMALAQGASEQMSSVDRLVEVLDGLNEKTHKSAEDARQATHLTEDATKKASVGKEEMGSLLNAMEEISEIATSISKIIGTIDGIAFQTNLLALNAAVEAARAGQHGKGFAVVADEVRNLANRSKKSAEEISKFLQGSLEKIGEGKSIANQTSNSLNEIVQQVSDISKMIGGFADVAAAQESGIADVSDGIRKIAAVTQANTSSSEEEAAFSQELSSQAEVFKNTVARFKLGAVGGKRKASPPPMIENRKDETAKPVVSAIKPVAARPAPVMKPTPATADEKPVEELIEKPAAPAMSVTPSTPSTPSAIAKPAAPAAKPLSMPKPAAPPSQATAKSAAAKPVETKPAASANPDAPKLQAGKPILVPPPASSTPGTPGAGKRAAPSGASVYDRKDYGKY
ncbi:MAG: methyl-accepting chemotaxis protein, partial [Defluviitaleaceae bacterium]|nr:methyl-accepting chemotaxis protein [Defluviitaleaceae bacterium]